MAMNNSYSVPSIYAMHLYPNEEAEIVDDNEFVPNPSETEYTEETVPTGLEYARYIGLTTDYQSYNPLHIANLPLIPEDADDEDVYTFSPIQQLIDQCINEQLSISTSADNLLNSVIDFDAPLPNSIGVEKPSWTIKTTKIEPPLLQSDDELDLFPTQPTRLLAFQSINLQSEQVDIENDEGIEWPARYTQIPAQVMKGIGSEKFTATKSAMLLLQDALNKHKYNIEDDQNGKRKERKKLLDPISPPLLPLTPPLTPFVDLTSLPDLDELSEDEKEIQKESSAIESELISKDALLLPYQIQNSATDDDMPPETISDQYIISTPKHDRMKLPPIVPFKRKLDDLKLEVPLFPKEISPESRLKSVSFHETVQEFSSNPLTLQTKEDFPTEDQSSQDTMWKELVAKTAEDVEKRVNQEQLIEMNTTNRVKVPQLDTINPRAPWDEYSEASNSCEPRDEKRKRFLKEAHNEIIKISPHWSGIAKIERELTWTPFPQELGKLVIEENLEYDELVENYTRMFQPCEIVTSDQLTWKKEGIRILDDSDEEEDELHPSAFYDHDSIEYLAHKRKLEMEEEKELQSTSIQRAKMAKIASNSDNADEDNASSSPSSSTQNLFSTTSALHRFMQLHGKSLSTSNPKEVAMNALAKLGYKKAIGSKVSIEEKPKITTPYRLPTISESKLIKYFVLSATLFKRRQLMKQITLQYPEANFIERDYTSTSSPADEADIVLSPGSGLIIITIQQVRQRPLPGHSAKSGIKERILYLSERYEHLIVLVSDISLEQKTSSTGVILTTPAIESQAQSTTYDRELDDNDGLSISTLAAFTSSLTTDVSVIYIPGGNTALASWIVAMMMQYGFPVWNSEGDSLLQEETVWELFLRRAGLNPFAAQFVLSSLKHRLVSTSPSTEEFSQSDDSVFHITKGKQPAPGTVYGLPEFVMMPQARRNERFGAAMGGNRVLERVGRFLDERWPSAAHGYHV